MGAQARWVTDGNIWTSSGVAAGNDAMIAFIEAIYSNATATTVANGIEYDHVLYHSPICCLVKRGNTDFWSPRYERHLNSTEDPFAALYNLTNANNSTNLSCDVLKSNKGEIYIHQVIL
jgi:transcriptional regulator GlxA family with amidase domain